MLGAGCVPADRKDLEDFFEMVTEVTIPAIHGGEISSDEVVLEGVVAVLDRQPGEDWFIVQDPSGGEYAGLEVHLHHAMATLVVAVGDELTIEGTIRASDGRMILAVDRPDAITLTGRAEVAISYPGPVTDWEPYNGVVVAPGPATLLDCGETAGHITTDLDLSLDFTHLDTPITVGTGVIPDGLQGVLHGFNHAWLLSLRTAAELGSDPPRDGCPSTVFDARDIGHLGRFVAEDVVVTGVQPDGTRAFVQDPGGGPGSGLELSASPDALAHLAVSDRLSVGGLLHNDDGPLTLRISHLGPPSAEAPVTVDIPDGASWTGWDGALVSLGPLEITGTSNTGRADTAQGIELVDVLMEDATLPEGGRWIFQGPLRVDDRTDPPAVQLLPRSPADWSADD